MGHVVRETDWCTIDLDTTAGRVFFQQRWMYNWVEKPPYKLWTLAEKRNFHRRSDVAIWAVWSNQTRLGVSGTSAFARTFARSGVHINLDVRWVLAKGQWTVYVTKVANPGDFPSEVKWGDRKIFLGSTDFNALTYNYGPKPTSQRTVAHEFGHAVGNTYELKRGDEYKSGSPYAKDFTSIMHTGGHLRARHFRTIIEVLDTMVPDTKFSISSKTIA